MESATPVVVSGIPVELDAADRQATVVNAVPLHRQISARTMAMTGIQGV